LRLDTSTILLHAFFPDTKCAAVPPAAILT
jgi:hypothetical protein